MWFPPQTRTIGCYLLPCTRSRGQCGLDPHGSSPLQLGSRSRAYTNTNVKGSSAYVAIELTISRGDL